MALLVTHALEQMRTELGGGDIPTELGAFSILNQAGEHLYSMHPWRWAVGRSALLDLRGVASGSTATWTASTKTLTQASGFTDYSFLSGDEIQITDGTGATEGVYKIASRTSANEIVLATSLAAGNLATGDIEWRIDPATIELPDDLRDIISIERTTQTSLGGVCLTTLQRIAELRASFATVRIGTGLFYGAVAHAGNPPAPILEIHPVSGSNQTGAMRIFYRSRWTTLTTDSSAIEIPDFMQALFIQVARAFAGGYIREAVATLSQRLAEIQAGPLMRAAVRSDGMIQPWSGMLRNGGAMIHRRSHYFLNELNQNVEPPSI